MSRKIGVAVVGLGVIGKIHIQAFLSLDNVDLISVYDLDETVAADSTQGLGSTSELLAQDLNTILNDERIDLVSICVPSGSHLEVARKVVEAGKHAVIEKPIDVDLTRVRAFSKLVDENKSQRVFVISQHRFDPSSIQLERLVREKKLGHVTTAIASVAWWRSQAYYDSAAWRGTWAQDGGGALLNQGVHTLDLLLWMMGRPKEVFAFGGVLAHTNIEVEDALTATIKFENGSVAAVHATTNAFPGIESSLQIMGTTGSAKISNDEISYLHIKSDAQPVGDFGINGLGNQIVDVPSTGFQDASQNFIPHARQLGAVADALINDGVAGVSVEEAYLALATVKAIYTSMQLGDVVVIQDVLDGVYDDLVFEFGVDN